MRLRSRKKRHWRPVIYGFWCFNVCLSSGKSWCLSFTKKLLRHWRPVIYGFWCFNVCLSSGKSWFLSFTEIFLRHRRPVIYGFWCFNVWFALLKSWFLSFTKKKSALTPGNLWFLVFQCMTLPREIMVFQFQKNHVWPILVKTLEVYHEFLEFAEKNI